MNELEWEAMDHNKFRVTPNTKINLDEWDPNDISGTSEDKDEAKSALKELTLRLESLQELLFAEHKHKVLIVLQGMDTSGKDGIIRHVFEGVNPQGVNVAGFKVPTSEELDHDYLWRIHKHTPGRGNITIFNRSHYEDVLVVRVHNLVPPKIWKKRYHHINEFERILTDEGTTILKFFLHISKEEQKERLQARLDDPSKHWKFSLGDLKERALWNDYQSAYAEALHQTSTDYAPWFIVPSNRKWFRNFVVASVIVQTLDNLGMKYPETTDNLDGVVIQD